MGWDKGKYYTAAELRYLPEKDAYQLTATTAAKEKVVYEGKFTGQFAEEVRTGKFGVAEGVVCKGGTGGTDIWMAKIKTYAYMERLKASFAKRWEDFWE